MKNWLVLDVHYLCHRAYHTTKDLSHKGKSTGVVFGFLKEITYLKDEFQTDNVAFCFEHRHLFRRDIYPAYKRRRNTKERTDEEKASYKAFAIQIGELRQRYLPQIGFKNVFSYRGMESDDIMASIAANIKDDERAILVTADKDLFQCLRDDRVWMYSPTAKVLWTEARFTREYGIAPRRWAVVKALAGCNSDEVPGIRGVGEATALQYLKGKLKQNSRAYQLISSADARAIVNRNRKLVQLPYENCPKPELQEDEISSKGWREVCKLLGMRTLAGRPPISTRRLTSRV